MLRLLDELLWTLRRDGFVISTAQALDAARAAALVGFADRRALREALAAVVVQRASDREHFCEAFEAFFSAGRAHAGDFWGRLRERGFPDEEVQVARELLDAVIASGGGAETWAALVGAETALDGLLGAAGVVRALAVMSGRPQVGFFAQRVEERVGLRGVGGAVRRLRDALRGALGEERGAALADAFAEEVERLRRRVRVHVERVLARRSHEVLAEGRPREVCDVPFVALTPAEEQEVRRALRRVAEKLRGAERVRRRHARKGAIDAHRTLRQSFRTGGIPFEPAHRHRRRDKPRLWLLCDISDSVRAAARFLLELVGAAQELFAGTRSFVFVSELGETTALFSERGLAGAFARIASGRVVPLVADSNYGRVFREFEARCGSELDRRSTVVVLGDGRTNFHADGADVVRRLRERCGALLWICPDARGVWGAGDSAMSRYEQASTKVVVARTARELEAAARELVARR